MSYWWLYYSYLYNCRRQLYFYNKWVQTDNSNLDIIIWKINHEDFSKDKELKIWNIAVDKITRWIVYEYKKWNKLSEWDISQLNAYMYILSRYYNIKVNKWILKYKNWPTYEIVNDYKVKLRYLKDTINIKKILNWKIPNINNNINFCKRCWYYEKCYI